LCIFRYSPLTIKFALTLKAKLGKTHYDGLRKVFQMPTGRQLLNFRQGSPEAPDGVIDGILGAMREKALAEGFKEWQFRWSGSA
jgi:hypothetical protein